MLVLENSDSVVAVVQHARLPFSRLNKNVSAAGAFLPGTFAKLWTFQSRRNVAGVLLVVLAFTPCGDAFSVDSRFAKIKKERPAFAYAYPILLMQLLVAWTYFSSAIIKLRVAGWKYLSADNLPALAIFHSLDNLHDTSFRLAFRLPELKAYLPFVVALILLWELLFPLAVFWRRVRWWLLGVGIAFHISTLFLMNIFFPHHCHVSALHQLGSL